MPAQIGLARGRIRVAHVRRPHGVNGEVRLEPLGSDAGRFFPGLRLRCERTEVELTVKTVRPVPDGDLLVAFSEAADRTGAEALRGTYLGVESGDVRRLGDDEWFIHQLVGLRSVDGVGTLLGTVTDIESYVGHDVVVVENHGSRRRFPMVSAFVQSVDLATQTMVITPWAEDQ